MNEFNQFLDLLRQKQYTEPQDEPTEPEGTVGPSSGETETTAGRVSGGETKTADERPSGGGSEAASARPSAREAGAASARVPSGETKTAAGRPAASARGAASPLAAMPLAAPDDKLAVRHISKEPLWVELDDGRESIPPADSGTPGGRPLASHDPVSRAKTRYISGAGFANTDRRRATGDSRTIYIEGSDKGSLLRAIAKSSENSESDPGQLVMDGFAPSVTNTVEERGGDAALEEELRHVREKRMEDFGLPTPPEEPPHLSEDDDTDTVGLPLPLFLHRLREKFAEKPTAFTPVKTEEYRSHDDRRRVFTALVSTRRMTLLRLGITLAAGLALLLANMITAASAAGNNGFFAVFGGSTAAYATVNLLLLLAGAVPVLPDLKNGVLSLLQLKPKTEAALLGMYLASLLQAVALYFTKLRPEQDFHSFAGACVLLTALFLASKLFWYDNTRHCFKVASLSGQKAIFREVRSPRALSTLLSERETAGVRADFYGKTEFITGFLRRSADAGRTAMPRSLLAPVLALLSLLCGVFAAIAAKSPLCGLSALSAAACLSFPVCGVFASGVLVSNTNRHLSSRRSFVQNLADAHGFVTVDHYAFSESDLFRAKIVSTVCTDGLSESAAATCAAVLANAAGGTMRDAFRAAWEGKSKHLPAPEDFTVEERLGVCAWVDNCRVLLGSREMLVNHNVPLPPEAADTEEFRLYLAIEGSFAAAFGMEYRFEKRVAAALRSASEAGVNLLIRAVNPNISSEMVQARVGLPENSVKIVPNAGGDLFDSLHDSVSAGEAAGVVTAGGFEGLSGCAGSCVSLDRSGRIAGFVCTAGAVVGVLAAVLLSVTGGVSRASGWTAVLLQLLWTALSLLVPYLAGLRQKSRRPAHKKRKAPSATPSPADKASQSKPAAPSPPSAAPAPKPEPAEQLSFVLNPGFGTDDNVFASDNGTTPDEETQSAPSPDFSLFG